MPALILLIHANERELRGVETFLSEQGYLVSAISTFRAASKLLNSIIPDLLIADNDLGAFTGLDFAMLSKRNHPHLPVLITAQSRNADVAETARQRGFALFEGSLNTPAFLSAVKTTLGEYRALTAMIRRWPRKPIPVGSVQLGAPPGDLVDISYGGCRLILADAGDPSNPLFDVSVPQSDVTLKVKRIWTGRAPGMEQFWCGAKLVETDPDRIQRWREFVDAIG
jgi:CheY-like chemotaxis protein